MRVKLSVRPGTLPSSPRYATCGACGCEREVTDYIRRTLDHQFKARPSQPTDVFYCGCEDGDDLQGGEPW